MTNPTLIERIKAETRRLRDLHDGQDYEFAIDHSTTVDRWRPIEYASSRRRTTGRRVIYGELSSYSNRDQSEG